MPATPWSTLRNRILDTGLLLTRLSKKITMNDVEEVSDGMSTISDSNGPGPKAAGCTHPDGKRRVRPPG